MKNSDKINVKGGTFMPNLLDDVNDLMKLSEEELDERLLDPKYNKALLRELVRRSIKMANDYQKLYQYKKEMEENIEERVCSACNGSGVYDHFGSPPCGSCDGTGKTLA